VEVVEVQANRFVLASGFPNHPSVLVAGPLAGHKSTRS
jgi:hypothetical protein